jgi:transposase InsO family protein
MSHEMHYQFSGNKYILTVTCKFTKITAFRAVANIRATTIAQELKCLFNLFGWPLILLSDQGREFCNSIIDHLLEAGDVERRVTSAYHPQTNGQTERMNQIAWQ